MQFSRKVFYNRNLSTPPMYDITKPNNMNSFLKGCGFKYGDNTEIDLNTEIPRYDITSSPLKFIKWGYENRYNSNYQLTPFPYIERLYTPGAEGLAVDWQPYIMPVSGINKWVIPYGQSNNPMFFIPLKNRGFILTAYSNSGSGYSKEGANNTPKLYSYNYLPGWDKTGEKTSSDALPFFFSMCGIFNNITNNYDYIWSYSQANQNSPYTIAAYCNAINTDYLFTKYAPTSLSRAMCDADENKTDIKSNCVTLLKTPFGNGFLDNLYTAITIPEEGKKSWYDTAWIHDDRPYKTTGLENKFFSVNGRNFYGLLQNLVVELSSN